MSDVPMFDSLPARRAPSAVNPITHAALVERAGCWLRKRRRCSVVLLEPGYGSPGEIPDALGYKITTSILVECKATRNDFLADRSKRSRKEDDGMGAERWYFAPYGLISPDELPEGWGLLGLRGDRVYRLAEPRRGDARSERGLRREVRLLSAYAAHVQHRHNGFLPSGSRHREHNFGGLL